MKPRSTDSTCHEIKNVSERVFVASPNCKKKSLTPWFPCIILCFFTMLVMSACVSRLPSHSYESRFYIADKSVAYLDKAEWTKIKLIIEERKGYIFRQAIKINDKLIEIRLEERGNKHKGIYVFFELNGGAWNENKEKEEEFVLLVKKTNGVRSFFLSDPNPKN